MRLSEFARREPIDQICAQIVSFDTEISELHVHVQVFANVCISQNFIVSTHCVEILASDEAGSSN